MKIRRMYDKYMKIDGFYYEEIWKNGERTFVQIDAQIVAELEDINEDITRITHDYLDTEVVIKEALRRFSPAKLKKLHESTKRQFEKKTGISAETRSGYCVDLRVGNNIIPIINDGLEREA